VIENYQDQIRRFRYKFRAFTTPEMLALFKITIIDVSTLVLDIKAQHQLKKLIEEVNLVADRAEQISRESSSSDFPKGKPDLVSQINETIIRSLVEDGSAQTREEAIRILEEEM
jgi:hypothetical protein